MLVLFCAAQLVERNPQLQVDPLRVSMHDEIDIINLAKQIRSADEHLKNSTSQKLVVILDQVPNLLSALYFNFIKTFLIFSNLR